MERSSLDDLFKKWGDLKGQIRAFGLALKEEAVRKLSEQIQTKLPAFKQLDLKVVAGVIVACLTLGFLVGFAATQVNRPYGDVPPVDGAKPTGWFSSWFGKTNLFPGKQPDGSFGFSNFETPQAQSAWKLISAALELSTHYAWEGSWSGKVSFAGGKDVSSFMIDDLGRGRNQPSDWSKYGALQFYVFQSSHQSDQLVFMVTDLWGKKYEETLGIPRGTWVRFALPVEKMGLSINTQKVNQFSLSRRKAQESADFYFDDVRLLPSPTVGGAFSRERMMDYKFSERKQAWMVQDPQLKSEVVHVPFIIKNETAAFCRLCPVEGGIPFPMGELQDPGMIRIRNPYGEDLPFQTRVLARWPDRSVKWLETNFQATIAPFEGAGFFLDYGPKIRSFDFASPLRVVEDEESIVVNTGSMEASLSKSAFYLFDRVSVDQNGNGFLEADELMTSHAKLTLDFRGKEFRTDLDRKTYRLEVEERGSQKVVIKASGWYQSQDGERFCQAIVRYYFYQGKSQVKLSHTLIYTGYPANEQYAVYKIEKLPTNEMVERFGLQIPYRFSDKRDEQVFLGLSRNNPLGLVTGNALKLYQKDYDTAIVERDGQPLPQDDALAGWLDLSDGTRGLAIALRHFRENFPKAYQIDRVAGEIRIDLWPKEAGPLDLSTTSKSVGPDDYGRGNAFGLAKTHDVMIYFHNGNAAQAEAFNVVGSFSEPLLIRANPYWVDATGALGRLFPVDQKYATEEQMLERLFDWAARQPRNFKWYGMLDFGDTLTWWRNSDGDGDEPGRQDYKEFGWHPVGRWGWYNCEGVGTHTGALIQYVRSGRWKYFDFGENLARHIMDIDTVHYDTVSNDKRLRSVINERYSRVGAMHRHSGDHWSGRTDEASHTNVLGLLLYYYLSGNERAFDVAKEVGEYFLTEPFTYIGHPDVAPNRAMANALWGDVLLYQATWDSRYKKAADKIVKIFLKGQQPDGSFLENYNPILKSWGGGKHELYMAGYIVGALMSYHELTQDEAVKEVFLRLVRYLAPRQYMGETILHGIAYAYWITRDPFFIAMAEANLKNILAHQQFSNDPILDGIIYEKPIYHRPMAYLSTVPYIFGAFEEHFKEQQLR